MKRIPKLPNFVSDLGIFLLKSAGWLVIAVLILFITSYFVKLPPNRVELFSLLEVLFGIVITALTIVASFVVAFQWNALESNRREVEDMTKKQEDKVKILEASITTMQNDIGTLTKRINDAINEASEKLDRTVKGVEVNFTERLDRLAQQIEKESQIFIEAAYYFSVASMAYRVGDNEHAIEDYLRALKLQPKNPRILERLGRAYSNLNNMKKAQEYLEKALEIDPGNEPALRSLALYYRYINKTEAIASLERIVQKNPSDYEAWDFLGLLYRDLKLIDKAIDAHEHALLILERPETKFYLSILLLYSPNGDKIRAKDLMSSAIKGSLEKENDQRIRPVWKILIQAGIPIIEGRKEEALRIIQTLRPYITTDRIHEAVNGHLEFLLKGAGHEDWLSEFMI